MSLTLVAVVPVVLAAIAGIRSLWSPCGLSVAETTYLTVSGARRVMVVALLIAAGVVTGGGLGLVTGGLWNAADLPAAGPWVTLAVIGIACLLDAFGVTVLAVGKQLPTAWGRLFGPALAAVLYGARLGIGPLTILMTWLWWAAVALAATHGPWIGLATGVVFTVARIAAIALAVQGSQPMTVISRMDRVRSLQHRVAVGTGGIAVVIAVVAVVAA
jgi:hypothetical protein